MGVGLGEVPAGRGALNGSLALWRRSAEEEEVGMGGGLGGALAGGGNSMWASSMLGEERAISLKLQQVGLVGGEGMADPGVGDW